MRNQVDKYRKLIQKGTQRVILLPEDVNQGKKSIFTEQSNQTLPSSYPFRSSRQIDNNISITQQNIHNILKQPCQQSIQLYNEWPQSCIGLVLCEHHQSNQTFYVYGTGTLIHNKILLTSAQNVYCRRLHKKYINIRFITGVIDNKCSGIYDVKQVYYPKEYTMQEYQNYNFALLQLYHDLSDSCGYVGWKTAIKPVYKQLIAYAYISDTNEGSFKLQEITKHKNLGEYGKGCSGNGVLIKEKDNKHYIVGLDIQSQIKGYFVLNEKMRNIVNQWLQHTTIHLRNNSIGNQGCKYLGQSIWTYVNQINLAKNNIFAQGCKYLIQANWTHLNSINLNSNSLGSQGCMYLSQAKWQHLNSINLYKNNIDATGCNYLSQANWTHLTAIYLETNKIDAEGCKYLSQAKWIHLNRINLYNCNIGTQGCKYLSKTNWKYLNSINLSQNKIDSHGCKYLSQANWTHLTTVALYRNIIGAQGCKYLSQANWKYLNSVNLESSYIDGQGCKYLSQANWKYMKTIMLIKNNIDAQGCKYLSATNWKLLTDIYLKYGNIMNVMDQIILKQLWQNAQVK